MLTLVLLALQPVKSQNDKSAENLNLSKGLAIDGYDPVAYFSQSKAVKGKREIAIQQTGTIYHFSTESNRELFKKNPAKYTPAYGGWCAFAMGDSGEKVSINPETFKIVDGKLLLFYNAFFTNTLDSWNKDEKRLYSNANQNWNNLTK